jgi:O-antigen ligase
MNRLSNYLRVWTLAPVLVLGPALTCGIPRIMAPLFMISALLTIAADCWMRRARPTIDRHLGALFGAFLIFGMISYLWTINPDDTFSKTVQLGMIFLPLAFLVQVIRRMSEAELKKLGQLAMAGFGIGLTVFCIEKYMGHPFYETLRGGQSNDVVDNKENKAIVLLAFWMYIMAAYARPVWGKIAMTVIGCVISYLTINSPSDSAQLIMMVMPVFIAIVLVLPTRLLTKLVLTGTCLLTLSMPLISYGVANHTNWKDNYSLTSSVRSRIEIWDQTARRSFEKPVFGWGLQSSPMMPSRGELAYDTGHPIHHMHPHNAPLQIWFETGLLGIAMTCAMFFVFYRRINAFSSAWTQKYAVFMWGGVFAYTLSIWGLWQTWFSSTLAFMGLMTYAGARYIEFKHSSQNKTAA